MRLGCLPAAPTTLDRVELPLELVRGHAPTVVRRPGDPRPRVAQRERNGACRVRRREQTPDRPAVGQRDDHGTFTPGVEDGADVVHPFLDRRES